LLPPKRQCAVKTREFLPGTLLDDGQARHNNFWQPVIAENYLGFSVRRYFHWRFPPPPSNLEQPTNRMRRQPSEILVY